MVLRALQGIFVCIVLLVTNADFIVCNTLGFTESIVSPAFLLITGLSYRKQEHAMRVLIWGMWTAATLRFLPNTFVQAPPTTVSPSSCR